MLHALATLALALPVPAPAPPPPVVQDEEAGGIQDEREDVKEWISTLKGHIKKKGREDEQAISIIDKFMMGWQDDEFGPKDRASIVKALDGCFKVKRTGELEPGIPDNRIYMATAVALGRMGPESVKSLIGMIDHKSHKKDMRLQTQVVKSLGKTRHPDGVKPLQKLLKHPKKEMQAAGAEALGEYDELDLKARKKIFEDLLKTMMSQKSKVDSDPNDFEARERWDTIAGPIITSLQRLSGQDVRHPDDWQRWWNKNKKADWDDEEE